MIQDMAIALVTGPTSAMNLAAACAHSGCNAPHTIALLANEPDSPLSRVTHKLVDALFEDSDFTVLQFKGPEPVSFQLAQTVGTLWLCRPYRAPEQWLASYYPEAQICLFDEGIGSLVSRKVSATPTDGSVQTAFRQAEIPQSLLSRCVFWFSTVSGLGKPSHAEGISSVELNYQVMVDILERIYCLFESEVFEYSGKSTLVIGTAFHLYKGYSKSDEQRHYWDIIKHEAASGRQILWAEHPRVPDFWNGFDYGNPTSSFANVKEISWPKGLPIEILAPRNTIHKTISLGSSAQATLAEWFGVNAEITISEPFENLPNQYPQIGLMRQHFSHLRL